MESIEITLQSLQATQILVKNITPNKTVLKNEMTEELFATEEALNLVLKGDSFRDAYQKIGQKYASKAKNE